MSKSEIEELLAAQIRLAGLPEPERELRFYAPIRQWRFDFAWPDWMLAAEVHGGVWVGGRHTRGAGFTRDAEKYTAAALLGWRLMHFTSAHVRSGEALNAIEEALT